MNTFLALTLTVAAGALSAAALADPPLPSEHQLVKECMAKQKEADSGKPKDELRAMCRDWAKTQRDADKQSAPPKP